MASIHMGCRSLMNALTVGAIFWFAVSLAKAADDDNKYIGYGPGGKRCEDIGAAIQAGHEPLFQAWLSGFITAQNYGLAGTKDILGDQDLPKAWRWIRTFCDTHKSAALADVAALLVLNKMDVIADRYKVEAAKIILHPPLDTSATGSIHDAHANR